MYLAVVCLCIIAHPGYQSRIKSRWYFLAVVFPFNSVVSVLRAGSLNVFSVHGFYTVLSYCSDPINLNWIGIYAADLLER